MTADIAQKANISDVFQKQVVNNDTFMIFNSKFRYQITNDKVILQFYGDAGSLITDSWLDILSVNVNDADPNQRSYSNVYTKTEVDSSTANKDLKT